MNNQNSQGQTTLITIGFDGTPASGGSRFGSSESRIPSISADGRYVAFSWGATNLVPNDTNDSHDVFVRDLEKGVTELISVAPDGSPGNNYSILTSMSSDGRFVAFYSAASNLVPDDTNNAVDIFVRDRQTGITELVSVATDGTLANHDSLWPSISDDGRYVAFSSWASNLVPNNNSFEPYNYYQLQKFVRDRQTGVTELVSVATDGTPANNTTGGYSWGTSISADGRYVAFMTAAGNLVPNDNDNDFDIFVRDLQQGTTELVSVISDDFSDDYWIPGTPSISADGRYIAFSAYDSRLLAPFPSYSDYDDESAYDDAIDAYYVSYDNIDRKTFIRDRQTGVTELVSVASDGTPGNKNSDSFGLGAPSISADGRYVAFGSEASNLVSGDTNNSSDIFVRDRQTGITELVSVTADGYPANTISFDPSISSFNPSISSDGRYVVFFSAANNLVPNDTNDSLDVFVRDRGKSSIIPGVANHHGGLNINTSALVDKDGHPVGINLSIEERYQNYVVYTSEAGDILETGNGDDIVNSGDGNNYINSGAGNDIIRAGDGEDDIRGGKGADVLIGGHGLDTFIIKGDKNSGAYGPNSDLHFDNQGKLIVDQILDFNDHEDVLVLQDMGVNGVGTVSYHSDTGNVTLTDTVNGEVTSNNVIAILQPGLDIAVIDEENGNWTIL